MNDPSASTSHGQNLDAPEPEAFAPPVPVSESDEGPAADESAGETFESAGETVEPANEPAGPVDQSLDLDAIERDLTDVQAALERLNDGTYWTDEITSEPLPDEVLASFPLTRTVAGSAST